MLFTVLDSGYYFPLKEQADYLKTRLKKKNYKYRFVTYFDSIYPYCQVKSKKYYDYNRLRNAWETQLLNGEVQYVWENGRGGFKRSKPLQKGAVDTKNGIVYLGEGNFRKTVRSCPTKDSKEKPVLNLDLFEKYGNQKHIWMLHVAKDLVFAYAIDDKKVIDSFRISDTNGKK